MNMTIPELNNLVEVLEQSMKKALVGLASVRKFEGSENFECPWLKWKLDQLRSNFEPVGIFLMQDWGNETQSLADAKREIKDTLSGNGNDRTLKNLLRGDWSVAIEDGWLISNAVWGLRSASVDKLAPKCGYLGAKVHKRAFPIWGALVAQLAEAASSDTFTLVVAGEWASFHDFPGTGGNEKLAKYLKRWRDWTTAGPEKISGNQLPSILSEDRVGDYKGNVYYVSHPATWRCGDHDWRNGPPQPSI